MFMSRKRIVCQCGNDHEFRARSVVETDFIIEQDERGRIGTANITIPESEMVHGGVIGIRVSGKRSSESLDITGDLFCERCGSKLDVYVNQYPRPCPVTGYRNLLVAQHPERGMVPVYFKDRRSQFAYTIPKLVEGQYRADQYNWQTEEWVSFDVHYPKHPAAIGGYPLWGWVFSLSAFSLIIGVPMLIGLVLYDIFR